MEDAPQFRLGPRGRGIRASFRTAARRAGARREAPPHPWAGAPSRRRGGRRKGRRGGSGPDLSRRRTRSREGYGYGFGGSSRLPRTRGGDGFGYGGSRMSRRKRLVGRCAVNTLPTSPQRIATAWFKALAEIGGVPGSAARSRGLLQELAGRILAAPDKTEPMRELGAACGRALVDGNYTQPESMAMTVAVLEENLPDELSRESRTALYAGLASGYANALRERTRAEQELIRQAVLSAHRTGEGRFRAVFRNAALGIGVVDGTGRVLEVNERLARILGRDAPAVRGRTVDEFRDTDDKPEFCTAVRDLLAGRRGHYSAEKRFTAADGTVTWTRMQASTVRAADGSVELLIMMFEDITEQRRMNQRLLHQATHDALTGLPNRTMLLDRLSELLDEAKPEERIG